VQRDFVIEINRRTLKNACGKRYGWNPRISSIARTPYSFWKREDTRDGPALVADASSTALVWIYLFVIGDRPEQRRWAVVAGDDLAIRGDSCARIANWESSVLDSRGSLAVMGSCEQHRHFNRCIRSKHLLFEPCFSA
jgi:hypothetical protein